MSCGFFLLMELVPSKYQSWVGAALMIAEGSTQIIWVIYFVWISKNAFYFIWFVIGLNVMAAFATFYVMESPLYLFGMERYEECRQVLTAIAYYNGIIDYQPR